MKFNDTPRYMPATWRRWTADQKLDWCKIAMRSFPWSGRNAAFLVEQMNDLIGDDNATAGDILGHTPLSTHAATIMALSG